MRVLLALLVAGLVAFAGCLGGDDNGDDGPTDEPEPTEDPQEDPAPEQLEFSFGPSAGCEGSLTGAGNCVSFQGGPSASGIDGHWLSLDESYWGLQFTTTIDSQTGDSDCYFVAEDETTILGNAHNGSSPCEGSVPDDTAFMFLYSYVEPATGMTITFEA